MSESKIFEVGFTEYPETILFHRPVKIDVKNYPELEGKTEQEIMEYIKSNAYQMEATEEFYDSLGEEIEDQDVVREKIPHVGSDIWVELSTNDGLGYENED